jgi:hypothetical protein
VGQNYFDCNPFNTYNVNQALAACTAYAISIGGTGANCMDGYSCGSVAPFYVCHQNNAGTMCTGFCWGYNGAIAGQVGTCGCPFTNAGTWH